MHRVEPQVKLIGETGVKLGNLQSYLEGIGALWSSNAPSNIEEIIEVAGRSCYMSFPDGKGGYVNPNVSQHRRANDKYLTNIIDEGDGSILEHGWSTWALTNVSRVFTHELVRHRVGVAISQESLRYVKLEDLPVWIPQVFNSNIVAIREIEESFSEAERTYHRLCDIAAEQEGTTWKELDFDSKKRYTSAIRRIIPIGIATNMVWSCNMRTLRHVIEQRTAPWAEEEIRLVFGMVAKEACESWPNLFKDYTVTVVDGLPYYETTNVKV